MVKNAIVIGAGIGGLACAAALARRGVAVTLLEQAAAITEVGAGLQVSPNGLAVLRALGVADAVQRGGAVRARAVVLRAEQSGDTVARLDLTRLDADQRYLFVHRADLIAVLARAAAQANVSVELGKRVRAVIPGDLPTVELEDASTRRAELIVAADGVQSRGRAALNGADDPAFAGQVAWRATVPALGDPAPEATVTMGAGRHIVSYPVKGGSAINMVAVQERKTWAAEGWHHADAPQNLRAAFSGVRGPAADLLARVGDVALWGLFRHPVAPVWHRDGVVLLGDAAHPTLPFLAQGANMALEDAWVLAQQVTRQGVARGLPAYQAARGPRVSRVIAAADGNAWKYHLRPGPLRWAAHAALRTGSRLAPGRMMAQFDWLYRHDVTAP